MWGFELLSIIILGGISAALGIGIDQTEKLFGKAAKGRAIPFP
jgi:hypothetical protein